MKPRCAAICEDGQQCRATAGLQRFRMEDGPPASVIFPMMPAQVVVLLCWRHSEGKKPRRKGAR